MLIQQVIEQLEILAPPSLQESYDNAGLITGNASWECTGILVSLDTIEAIVEEAIANNCNLIVAHHPIVFGGLKKITGKSYVERTVIKAIKNDIAIYGIHTNLDNVAHGVNKKIADKLGLINTKILSPKSSLLVKLHTYAPLADANKVKEALFAAGAGHIGNYSECSFNTNGIGTYKAGEGTNPYIGEINKRASTEETKIEVILPNYLQNQVLQALFAAHPYEEVAYELVPLLNQHQDIGSGMVGKLHEPMEAKTFLQLVKEAFNLSVIKHTPLLNKPIETVALCGGTGSFLIQKAISAKADIYITGDIKYHEFFDADNKIIVADIGHYESEQFTIDLLFDFLQTNFPNFAVLKTKLDTNPVSYF